MKRNADQLATGNACQRCHSEPESTSGRAEDTLGMVNVGSDQVLGAEAIFGFGKCSLIQKSRLYAAGEVVWRENTWSIGLRSWDVSLSCHMADLKDIID